MIPHRAAWRAIFQIIQCLLSLPDTRAEKNINVVSDGKKIAFYRADGYQE